MMPTYGERREAARKLREIADEDEWIIVKLADSLGIDLMHCESREEGEAEVVRRIADLVDPDWAAMKDELLPCPFCGEYGAIVKTSRRWGYFVSCACAAVGPSAANRREAVERWNTRIMTMPVQGRLPI